MTTLGAALYTGFFSAAALWLFLTSEDFGASVQDQSGSAQRPDRSNSASTRADSGSRHPLLATHSSSK